MRTIVGSSTENTKDIKIERVLNLDTNEYQVPTNVSQYGVGGIDIKDIETAKHFASEAEKSAKEAASSASKSEDLYEGTLKVALEVQNNTSDSLNYLEEIRTTSSKIDVQEAYIDKAEKQVILHTTAAENAAQIASDSATSARASEANSASSASSANNSAMSAKESEQHSKVSEIAASGSAVKADQTLAQTEAVYNKTIDDVSKAVQSYLKDKGGFDPNAGLPIPDSWLDIFGVRKNLSCLWTADRGGILEGVSFSEGDVLLYNAELNRYGRFSGQLVTGGGGGGATEFFNDIKIAADKRLVGTDANGSTVELIKLVNDIVEAGDKTKAVHLLAKNPKSAFVCVANASSGFDNYEIYHSGNKPIPSDLGVYSKTEADSKFVDITGDMLSGVLDTTSTIKVKTREVYHPGNIPDATTVGAVSLTKSEVITGRKSFTQNPIIENAIPTLSLKESDTDVEVLVKVDANKLTIETSTSKPFDVDFNNTSVLISNPKSKTVQGITDDSLVRKDYIDTELSKKLDKTGNPTISSDLIITGKIVVEGAGSIFKDINTTGQVKEDGVRVYSPSNKPTAVDVGALPISGGNIGGAIHVRGNISTDGTTHSKGDITTEGIVSEKGQRVYSPNNRPTAGDINASVALSINAVDLNTLDKTGAYNTSNGCTNSPPGSSVNGDSLFHHQWDVNAGSQVYTNFNTGATHKRNKTGNVWSAWVRVYDEGFKPTAADVGAIGIDNVYNKTQADDRFWQRTETVNRSFSTDKVNSYSGGSEGFKGEGSLRSYNVVPGNGGYPNLGSGIFQGRIDGVKNQGWSLFNDISSDKFFLGKQKEDGSGFTWSKIYTESQKPTAVDVGALPLTGGVMTGPMTMASNSRLDGHNHVSRYGDSAASYTHYYDNLTGAMTGHDFRFAKGGGGGIVAYHMNGTGAFTSDTEGRFYSQGFKPTTAEIGAYSSAETDGLLAGKLSLTGGHLQGILYGVSPPTDITSVTNLRSAPYSLYGVGVGDNNSFVPFGHMSASYSGGYMSHLNFGLYKKAEAWGDENTGMYIALGGSDSNPTENFTFTYGGGIKHSKGHAFYSTRDFLVEKGAAADTVVRRTDSGGIHNNGLTSPGVVRVNLNPAGTRISGKSVETGAIKITLPTTGSECMLKIYVSVYNYKSDTSFDAVLSGYDASPTDFNIWYECSAVINGAASTPNHPVYFGKEGDKSCIWIGSIGQGWAYPQVTITKVESGYNGGNKELWTAGWDVSFVTSLGHVVRTISDALIKPGGANIPADEQATAHTLVKRNASGEISAKGRVLIANSNDSDVNAGVAYVDFVSSAGNSYGQIGDLDNSNRLRIKSSSSIYMCSASPAYFLGSTDNEAQKICTGGVLASGNYSDISKVPTNGVFAVGDVITGGKFINYGNSASHKGLVVENAGVGWSYIELNAAGSLAHIAVNTNAVEGATAGSLHLRPSGIKNGGLSLQPNAAMMHQTSTGYVRIGSENAGHVHFQTDRPSYHFDKNVLVQGDFYAGPGYNMRVYHQGFKPTPAEIGAHEVKPWIASPGMDANDSGNYTAFTYSNNAPHNGPLVSMGVSRYTIQFNSTYFGVQPLSFRTHNGDNSTWNPWVTLYTTSNKPTPADLGALPISGGQMGGNLHATGGGGFFPAADNNGAIGNGGWKFSEGWINNLNCQTLISTGSIKTTSVSYGGEFRGTNNVDGTGEAIFAPAGVYSKGHNWMYGPIETNGNPITCGNVTAKDGTFQELNTNGWLRPRANNGIHFESWGGGFHMTDATWIRAYGGKKIYVANTAFDSIQVGGGILLANGSLDNTGCGITGVYDATRFQGVFAMGQQYMLPQNGIGSGTLYGITWTHSNNPSAEARKVSGHQMCIMDNGKTYVAAGTGGIWAANSITAGVSMTTNNLTADTLYIRNIAASGRITTSSGFSGNGSGISNIRFGNIDTFEHVLFDAPTGLNGGNFVLSNGYTNYKALVFYMSDDGNGIMYSFTKTVAELNRLQSFNKPYGVISDANYHWVGRFEADGRTFTTRTENGRMFQVIGLL